MLTAFHDVKKIVEKNINLITEPLLNKTVQLLLEHSSGTTAEVLEEFKNKGERETVAGILMNENKVDDPLTVVQECIHTLKTHPIREKIQQTRLEIRELEAAGKDSSSGSHAPANRLELLRWKPIYQQCDHRDPQRMVEKIIRGELKVRKTVPCKQLVTPQMGTHGTCQHRHGS